MELLRYHDKTDDIVYEKVDPIYKTPVRVLRIKYDGTEEYCHIPPHWHRSLEIILPVKGASEVTVQGESIVVNANQFLVINSREIHACRGAKPYMIYDGYAIQIAYDFLKQCVDDIDTIYFQKVTTIKIQKELLKIFHNIIEEYKMSNKYSNLLLWSYSYLMIHILLTNAKTVRKARYSIESDKQKDRLLEVLNYMYENYAQDFDAKKMAEYFHISYGHLASLFKTYINMTMLECMQTIRIEKAVNNLIYTDYSITDIAYNSGFANIKSFYREFKKRYQQTPNEYRKNIK